MTKRPRAPRRRPPTGSETAAFRLAFETETGAILRRRVGWYATIILCLTLLSNIPIILGAILGQASGTLAAFAGLVSGNKIGYAALTGIWVSVYAGVLIAVFGRKLQSRKTVWASLLLITADGVYFVIARAGDLTDFAGIPMFALSHFIASIVFPWSPRQAVYPAAIVLGLSALSNFLIEGGLDSPGSTAIFVAISPLWVVPGTLTCWVRHSRRLEKFGFQFLQQRYGRLRQELVSARAIHESVFPRPRSTGDLRLMYRYLPATQIGGDYLFAYGERHGEGERMSVVLLDVTGHGIAAALSVNRLHGEIELMFAAEPDISPGDVMRRLNRYVNLTLAKHSVFVTGLAMRADSTRGVIEHASGGHPPAFVRGVDGTLSELEPTAPMLGAVPDRDFDPGETSQRFAPG
ncbi:MAG: PP2C family protein-serine/threonine phosphatase, partial [Planctomycetota bacterium]